MRATSHVKYGDFIISYEYLKKFIPILKIIKYNTRKNKYTFIVHEIIPKKPNYEIPEGLLFMTKDETQHKLRIILEGPKISGSGAPSSHHRSIHKSCLY